MKINLWNQKYKKRIFCYILIISLIPIVLLGFYSYRTYIHGITSNVRVNTNSTVRQVKDKVDTVFNNIRKSYIKSVKDTSVEWLLNEDIWYSDYSNLVQVGDTLAGPSFYSDFIEGYSFINFETNWVLSNRGMFPYDLVTNKEEVEEVWEYNGDTLIRDYWITKLTSNTDTLKREEINLKNVSLVIKLPVIQKSPYGLLIANINMRNMETFIYQDKGEHEITVINRDGEIICSSDKSVAIGIKELYDTCTRKQLDFKSQTNMSTDSKESHYISVIESNAMDWFYIASYNKELIQDGGKDIIQITLLILIMTLGVIMIAIIFTRKLYTPILRLSNYVTGISNSKEDSIHRTMKMDHEFEFLTHRFESLKDNKDLLEKTIANQLPQMLELFQLRLVRGEIREEQLPYYLENLKLEVPTEYVVLAINIKSQNGFEDYDEAKQDAIRMNIVEHMPTSILEKLFMQPICNARTILCTVSGENKEDLNERIFHLYKQLDEYISSSYGLKITIGVSSIQSNLAKYPYTYQESITALRTNDLFEQQLEEEHHGIMFYTDVSSRNQGYVYDNLLERELREAIELGERDKAFEIIDRLINSMVAHNVTSHEVTLSLYRILISIILVAYNQGVQVNQLFEQGLSNIFLKYNQLYDMNKIRTYLKLQVVDVVLVKLEEYRTSKSSEIMVDIQKIIDTSNGDITLTECAEQLGYHPTYIWKVMKVEKNTTFSTYVSEYKLEEAKKLLIETDYTVAEIAAKLNYTNAQNFIRFFSKLEGTTPGKYRQSIKNR